QAVWPAKLKPVQNAFLMPDDTVMLEGSFTAESYQVRYRLDGELPKGAKAPKGLFAATDTPIRIANLPEAVAGYSFSGWVAQSAAPLVLEGGYFTMPACDVTLVGTYVHDRYRVRYAYQGVAPSEAPPVDPTGYCYGDTVTPLAPPAVEGFFFLGWQTPDVVLDGSALFMPQHDITFTGRWLDMRSWRVRDIRATYDGAAHFLALSGDPLPATLSAEWSMEGERWFPLEQGFIDVVDAQLSVRVSLQGTLLCTLPARVVIAPRPLTLHLPSAVVAYNGAYQTLAIDAPKLSGELAPGDVLSPITPNRYDDGGKQRPQNERMNAGTWLVGAASVQVLHDGREVSANYAIAFIAGAFTITPAKGTVSVDPLYALYTGKPQRLLPNAHAYGESGEEIPNITYTYALSGKKYRSADLVPALRNAGEYALVLYPRDPAGNYTFAPEGYTAALHIQPIPLALTPKDATLSYTGQPQGFPTLFAHAQSDTVTLNGQTFQNPGLLPGHLLEGGAPEGAGCTAVGVYQNVTAYGARITEDGRDVTANYSLQRDGGTLTITPRPVRVLCGSAAKLYDGEPLSVGWTMDSVLNEQNMGMLAGDSVLGELTGNTLQDVGQSTAMVQNVRFISGDGRDVSANYLLTVSAGTVSIAPRPLRLLIGSASRMYDGKPLHVLCEPDGLRDDGNAGLARNHSAVVALIGNDRRQVGENAVTAASVHMLTTDGADVTANYHITVQPGMVSVQARPVRVLCGTVRKVYDGSPLSVSWAVDALMDEGNAGFAPSDTIQLTFTGAERTSIGTNAVSLLSFAAIGADGADCTASYALTTRPGSIAVLPVNTSYTIRYAYHSEFEPAAAERRAGSAGMIISACPGKGKPGMRLEYASGLPLTLSPSSRGNTIDVFYMKRTTPALAAPPQAIVGGLGIANESVCAE
ncbi:MAG: hypothetical protein RR367_08110, partial [Clostridia bacterium]